MNTIAEEIRAIFEEDEDTLSHYGMPRRSGRYPWGSGEDPYQHGRDFYGRVEEMRKSGFTYVDEKTGEVYSGDKAIYKSMGLSSGQFRTELGLARDERRMYNRARAQSLRDDGLNDSEIGRQLGVNESTVRSWFNEKSQSRMEAAKNTAEYIKGQVDKKGMVDVGTGVELELGVSRVKFDQALYILERQGYGVYKGGIPDPTNPGQQTNQVVLCRPEIKPKEGAKAPKEIYDFGAVKPLNDENYRSHDNGENFDRVVYPKSMDSKRLMIRYADDVGPDGARGVDKDGIVEIRRGVEDLSLGDSRYSQVRILVDDKKYIKGMAVYSDDLPDGVDVMFNTNKSRDVSKLDVLKDIKSDPDNPFGSLIKSQEYYTDKDGNRQLGLINKRADQGDWEEWSNGLPSQFLGKQSRAMAQKQLNLAKVDKLAEYDDICSLTNPTIKKHLLQKFADECDSAAVHLKAAALPGQKYHVIIPINSLKDNEVYAPNYPEGSKLALIRYPHAGLFEIPILTVTHKNPTADKIIGRDAGDAVGINKSIADQLSGADFDGDTVMCIPTHDRHGRVKIANRDYLEDLVGFDPKAEYGYTSTKEDADGTVHYYRGDHEYRLMKDPKTGTDGTQSEMGKISNLITDMTLGGADDHELARAVKHSMVVIDAAKHKLDYRQSELDNDIPGLRKSYQAHLDKNGKEVYGGASTILSRAKGQATVDRKQGTPHVNIKGSKDYDPTRPEGALIYKTADDLYYPVRRPSKREPGKVVLTTTDGKRITYDPKNKDDAAKYNPVKRVDPDTGEITYTNPAGDLSYKLKGKTQRSTKMAETDDAYTLVSPARHPMELVYADYANDMKALANQARKEMVSTGKIEYSASAKAAYREEVASLNEKLKTALLNAPRERAAKRKANADVQKKQADNPDMTKSDIKKAKQRALSKARDEVGGVSRRDRSIKITDKEWEAIQAGAITESTLKKILDNADVDSLRERATPRASTKLSPAKINKIQAMRDSNHSIAEIARACGCSTSAVSEYLRKGAN